MISTTKNNFELTRCINIRYALIQLYVDSSIFGYASRMYQCVKDIMTLYGLEKALYNAIYYNFDENDIEIIIYKIREYLGIINYISNIDYYVIKYPIPIPIIGSSDEYTTINNYITDNINNTYNTYNTEDWFSQNLTSLVISDGQIIIEGLDFNIVDIDMDTLILEIQGDNPEYSLSENGYHVIGTTLYWHNFYDLKIGMQIKVRWKLA